MKISFRFIIKYWEGIAIENKFKLLINKDIIAILDGDTELRVYNFIY